MRKFDADKFARNLKRRGYVMLGAGCFSDVYAKPGSDKVIKINRRADDWLEYVLWAAKRGYAGTHAPRVYSYRKNDDCSYVAVVERMEQTMSAIYRDQPEDYSKWNGIKHGHASERFPGAAEFMTELRREFPDGLDLHDENWMLRSDGSLVCTDPVSGFDFDTSSSATPKRMRSRELASLQAAPT